ncbi:E2 protein [Equus asinus papillomavirus 2]|uniref:Regulatory protein E2 n=1 Tax=Equus asinus papillomavirus 2 TaxID=2547428 RepID=A0A482EWD8_9PAPI|nr:E2 protein [Equus asinus papillomavirus 2]
METLRQRLDAVQEKLMTLLEEGNCDLSSQIAYWQTVRKENVLLYYARDKGISRLGLQMVPHTTVSQAQAKQAIHMELVLTSLQTSAHAGERWTLSDCSWERWLQPPINCLKKDPVIVEVIYDGDSENANWYTLWGLIYYQNPEGQWLCSTGHCDYTGLYYEDEGHKRYYVHFIDDAARYSKTRTWEVRCRNQTFLPSVPVTSTSLRSPPGSDLPDGVPEGGPGESPRPGALAASPAEPPKKRYRPPADGVSSTGISGGLRGSADWCRRKLRRTAAPTWVPPPLSQAFEDPQGSLSQAGGASPRADTTTGRDTETEAPPLEAAFAPIVIFQGGSNQCKCYRWRLKKRHRTLFVGITTTYFWTGDKGKKRVGNARLMVTFSSDLQRRLLLATVPPPAGVTATSFTLTPS